MNEDPIRAIIRELVREEFAKLTKPAPAVELVTIAALRLALLESIAELELAQVDPRIPAALRRVLTATAPPDPRRKE